MSISLQVQVKRARKTLREANRELKHYQLFERKFLMAIFHSVKTPVTIVKNSLWMLKKDSLSSLERRKYLDMAIESNDRLLSVLNSLHLMSQIEMNYLRFSEERFDLAVFVRKIVSKWNKIAVKKEKEMKVMATEKCFVMADKEKTEQIINHLLSNVVKFAEPGSVQIFVQNKEKRVDFCISDHGLGIPIKARKNLFTKFMHLGSDKEIFQHKSLINTGLGLWIIKNLIKKMNGEISFKSVRLKGTEFCFSLPRADK